MSKAKVQICKNCGRQPADHSGTPFGDLCMDCYYTLTQCPKCGREGCDGTAKCHCGNYITCRDTECGYCE